MSSNLGSSTLSGAGAEARPLVGASRREDRFLARSFGRGLAFIWKAFLGAIFCTNWLFSILVVGWTYRAVEKRVLWHWWRMSPLRRQGLSFEGFLSEEPARARLLRWPNWVLHQEASELIFREERSFLDRLLSVPKALFGSLVENARLGFQGIFNTWTVTLPGCALWLFAWFAGWNNSFHKGYELAYVGPMTGLFGVALFITAMLYLPFAQTRQAVSGERRRFYDFRFLRKLLRESPSAMVTIAGLYSAVGLPFLVLFALPTFLPQMAPSLAELSPEQALAFLKRYYFWVSVLGFGSFVFLRLVAARFYASAIVSGLRQGSVSQDELAQREREALSRLGLLDHSQPPTKHIVLRAVGWTGARLVRAAATVAILFLWFTFVAQIFVREFLHYHPVIGWLNQALVQLPYFSLIPTHLN